MMTRPSREGVLVYWCTVSYKGRGLTGVTLYLQNRSAILFCLHTVTGRTDIRSAMFMANLFSLLDAISSCAQHPRRAILVGAIQGDTDNVSGMSHAGLIYAGIISIM